MLFNDVLSEKKKKKVAILQFMLGLCVCGGGRGETGGRGGRALRLFFGKDVLPAPLKKHLI